MRGPPARAGPFFWFVRPPPNLPPDRLLPSGAAARRLGRAWVATSPDQKRDRTHAKSTEFHPAHRSGFTSTSRLTGVPLRPLFVVEIRRLRHRRVAAGNGTPRCTRSRRGLLGETETNGGGAWLEG